MPNNQHDVLTIAKKGIAIFMYTHAQIKPIQLTCYIIVHASIVSVLTVV